MYAYNSSDLFAQSQFYLPLVASTIGPGFTMYAIDPLTQNAIRIKQTNVLQVSMILTRTDGQRLLITQLTFV